MSHDSGHDFDHWRDDDMNSMRLRDYRIGLAYLGLFIILVFLIVVSDSGMFCDIRGLEDSECGGLKENIFTEILSIGITVLLVDRFNTLRQDASTKRRLIARLGSRVNSQALQAVAELKSHGWFEDGTLDDVDLREANLRNAHLGFDTHFDEQNSDRAQKRPYKLRKAQLQYADLQEAFLHNMDLRGVNFTNANLYMANLGNTDLRAANLEGADLTYAHLGSASFDDTTRLNDKTRLPDGKPYDPKGGLEQLKQFTIEGAEKWKKPLGINVPYFDSNFLEMDAYTRRRYSYRDGRCIFAPVYVRDIRAKSQNQIE